MSLDDIRSLVQESASEQNRFEPLPTKVAHRIDALERAILALVDEVETLQRS